MKQKKIIDEIRTPMKWFALLFVLAAISLPACKKYPDGPLISVIPKRERIEGKWVATSVKYNQTDSTSGYKNHIWEFTRQYSVILQVNNKKYTGTWSTQTSDKEFVIDYDSLTRETFKILRLTNKEFILLNKKSQLQFNLAPQ